MGHIFFLCPPAVRGSLTLGWRGLCHSRGALPFFLIALDVHRGSGIPKASPMGVRDTRLMALTSYRGGLSRGLSRDNLVIAGVIAWVIACVFWALASKPSLISCPGPLILHG